MSEPPCGITSTAIQTALLRTCQYMSEPARELTTCQDMSELVRDLLVRTCQDLPGPACELTSAAIQTALVKTEVIAIACTVGVDGGDPSMAPERTRRDRSAHDGIVAAMANLGFSALDVVESDQLGSVRPYSESQDYDIVERTTRDWLS
ncbi:hypothetical protein Y032_0110g175 [Ancylostoma ceylanicum]|nr:hypothetical protein Y032_0110g175 [Ancylostoma ceylanicum]